MRGKQSIIRLLLLLVLLPALAACGAGPRWYKDNRGQADFDKDSLECEIIARELARQATLTGAGEDLATFANSFNNCLYRKGWSNVPPPSAAAAGQTANEPSRPARLETTTVHGLGRAIAIPDGFTLISDSVRALGATTVHTLVFMGANDTFLTLVFQQSTEKVFTEIGYLVADPFFLYRKGAAGNWWKKNLRWAVFAGRMGDDWVTGLGGYLLVSKKERITLVVTRPLAGPESRPPAGLRLSRDQHEEVEKFQARWLPWLGDQVLN